MTPERWGRVKEIFAGALERDPAERTTYVDQACASDAALRSEVVSLLEAHETAGGFIEQEAAQRVGLASAAPRQDWIGRRLGPYRIVGEAGRGGMSQVFSRSATTSNTKAGRDQAAEARSRYRFAAEKVQGGTPDPGAAEPSEHRAPARRWRYRGRRAVP
jgi:hypothetical protein